MEEEARTEEQKKLEAEEHAKRQKAQEVAILYAFLAMYCLSNILD